MKSKSFKSVKYFKLVLFLLKASMFQVSVKKVLNESVDVKADASTDKVELSFPSSLNLSEED